MNTPTFTKWLTQFRHDNTARGDLARDVATDVAWPEQRRAAALLCSLLIYMQRLGASSTAIATMIYALRDYCREMNELSFRPIYQDTIMIATWHSVEESDFESLVDQAYEVCDAA